MKILFLQNLLPYTDPIGATGKVPLPIFCLFLFPLFRGKVSSPPWSECNYVEMDDFELTVLLSAPLKEVCRAIQPQPIFCIMMEQAQGLRNGNYVMNQLNHMLLCCFLGRGSVCVAPFHWLYINFFFNLPVSFLKREIKKVDGWWGGDNLGGSAAGETENRIYCIHF